MTYQNRLLTTPYYINNIDSPFWRLVASDTAARVNESCEHARNYWNMRVECEQRKQKLDVFVSCCKCEKSFRKTEPIVRNMIGYFGF